MEEFYSLKQTQTVRKPRFYPLLCQFLMNIVIVINPVCTCVRTSAEDDDFKDFQTGGGGGGGMCISDVFISLERFYVLVCQIQHHSGSVWVC